MNTDRLLFRFLHATDLHYDSGANPRAPEANARIACFIEDCNNLNAKEPLSFVLLSGDLTDCGTADENELSQARSLYNRLEIPWYTVAGNHDLAPNRKFAAMYPGKEDYHDGEIRTSNYGKILGAQGIRFSFTENGIRFIGISLRDEDPDGILDWLEEEIDKARGQIIVVSHYGLYPPRDAGVLHTWGFARIATILPRLRKILAGAGSRIIAYLYGHNHINSMIKKNGTYHISSGAIQKGCTGYRLFKCYSNRIESSYHLLSDETLWDFNYWGDEHPTACNDSTHKTIEEYHRGNREEQSFPMERCTTWECDPLG